MTKKKVKKDKENITYIDNNLEKNLFEWEQADRPYKKRDKNYWVTMIVLLILVSTIFFYMKEFMLIVALFSGLFLYYSLSAVTPENIYYRTTNRGVYYGDNRIEWALLNKFWVKQTLDSNIIYFETRLRFPHQISIIVNESDIDDLKKIISRRIPMLEDSPEFVDKVTKWVGKKFPIESKK
jgi:hypothetical protein